MGPPSGPPFAAPSSDQSFGATPSTPHGTDSPLGPPELRLYANEANERAEPYAPPPMPSAAPPPRALGPSDFTRMLTPVDPPSSAPSPPPAKPNANPQAAAAAGRKPSALPLILVVTFALITAAALILYVALKK